MSTRQGPGYQYPELEAKHNYDDHSDYNEEDGENGKEVVGYDSTWLTEDSQFAQPNNQEFMGNGPHDQSSSRERPLTPGEERKGFVSRGRKPHRHVPPRDFPHPQPNDPKLARSPVYGRPYSPQYPFRSESSDARTRGYQQSLDLPSDDDPYPSYYAQPANDLAVPEFPTPSSLKPFYPNIKAAVDKSFYDEFELPSSRQRHDPSTNSASSRASSPRQDIEGGANQREGKNEECDGSEDYLPPWCGERREASGRNAGDNCLIEFGVVGSTTETFWPKPGDILILANERKGCRWPAFDGHLEIYVDDDYFSKSSVALQWNYSFRSGDIVLRFGDFDRHWRWRANDHIHVFLRDSEVFYLVARQAAQELHPLDFRFVDPRQRPVHTVQYHMQPRVGDFILRKGSDDSDLWNTSWWHPGGDSHLLLKHLKTSYPQGPDPKYRWTCHWYKRGLKFQPEDVLLRVGYEGAEDNMHCYCVCEIYFRGVDGLWTFQGRDDYSFGPPSHT